MFVFSTKNSGHISFTFKVILDIRTTSGLPGLGLMALSQNSKSSLQTFFLLLMQAIWGAAWDFLLKISDKKSLQTFFVINASNLRSCMECFVENFRQKYILQIFVWQRQWTVIYYTRPYTSGECLESNRQSITRLGKRGEKLVAKGPLVHLRNWFISLPCQKGHCADVTYI